MSPDALPQDAALLRARWPAPLAWALAWLGLLALDTQLDLANQALLLVLASALAALWSGLWVALLAPAVSVLAFNFAFVPPRGAFSVGLHQHALLLVTTLAVSWTVALLVTRLRRHAARAMTLALRSAQMRQLGEALRSDDPLASQALALRAVLGRIGGADAALLLAGDAEPSAPGANTPTLLGDASADETAGMRLCLQDGRAMGPGTGRHEDQPAWYLPLRGGPRVRGVALVRLADTASRHDDWRLHAQALCDLMGAAVSQATATQAAATAREQAQAQALRNTLLSAISHDHRTPLAAILGAASALHDQGERLSPAQRSRLVASIIDEATQLTRLTDNTLQLARLGTAGLDLPRDWESVEELVGSVLHRVRQRDPGHRVKARLAAGLPLLHCNAVLMVQLLENLVDNALKYGGSDARVDVVARRVGEGLLIAVRDRGPGVPLALQSRIFETFQRGPAAPSADAQAAPSRRGAGVGLALCRAIARVHGGELRLRPRRSGGASFELLLPAGALAAPAMPLTSEEDRP